MTGDVVLMSAPRYQRRHPLPVLDVVWLPDRIAPTAEVAITMPGFRKGQKPPNWQRTFPPDPLTPEETLRVLAACGGGKTGVRNRAILVCLWRSGLRISEALALRPHDVDYDNNTVTVMCGKNGKRRTSGIDDWGLEQLQDWYAMRAGLRVPVGAPLFCCVSKGSVGNRVNPAFVRSLCKRLARDAGISKRCHPHGFRHGHAVDLARDGVPVHLISRQLGHSNLAVTANYLVGIAPEEVIQAVAARRVWRNYPPHRGGMDCGVAHILRGWAGRPVPESSAGSA